MTWSLIGFLLFWFCGFISAQYFFELPSSSPRCVRSLPLYHFIPITLLTPKFLTDDKAGPGSESDSGSGAVAAAETVDVKRVPRQQQILQEANVNDNFSPVTGFGGAGFRPGFRPVGFLSRTGFGSGLGSNFGTGGGFGRFRARTKLEPEQLPSTDCFKTPPCPHNYIMNCEPSLTPVSCRTSNCDEH